MATCSYCGNRITGAGHTGRPWPNHAPAHYCCFGCLSLGEQQQQERVSAPASVTSWAIDGLGIRIGISLIVVAQSMIFGLALNLHDDVPATVRGVTQSLILAATLLVAVLLGGPLLRTAWHELRHGRLTIEALFLLTMSGALVASLQAQFMGTGKIYYEVISILLVVYTLGKVIGARSRAAAVSSSRAWGEQLSSCRIVDSQGRTRTGSVTELLPGDCIEVNPGETIAIDGVIRTGVGFIAEAAVTGEAFSVVRRPGDRVLAGSASHDTTFRIEATTAGTDRQIDRLLAVVEAARDKPLSLQARADALGHWFFPLVVFTALGTFAYWSLFTSQGWEAALFYAMSVLLVACPCVIGLATPIVVWSALGRLAERGLIIRTADAIERLAQVDSVMIDKTGTLTDDTFALIDIATVPTGAARRELLGWLAFIESRSQHPVARAFAQLTPPQIEPQLLTMKAVPGCGVEATLQVTGRCHTLQIGTPQWIAAVSSHGSQHELESQLSVSGHQIAVACDGHWVSLAVLAEQLRESTPQALAAFRRLQLPVEVLTGDRAERVATLGLPPARAGMLPDDKHAAVNAARATGRKPLFIGDGINDAAALASAHVGIALASGTDLAVGAADITLYHGDLRAIPWAVELSRAAVRAMRRNLYRALGYNLIGMTLAACGLLHPVVAALLMVLSSLSLIFSSTRIGVPADHCNNDATPREDVATAEPRHEERPIRAATLHALAIAGQGVAFLLLLAAARDRAVTVTVLAAFTFVGLGLGYLWLCWSRMPHTLDMCFGMLTLGNLGMLLGWWADNGFTALHDGGCCACVAALHEGVLKPWMWLGMLLFANIAMFGLDRNPGTHSWQHRVAMLTGGNVGMVLGMLAGGWCAAQVNLESVPLAAATAFATMTIGMLAGMLLGTWLTEWLLTRTRELRVLPGWLRRGKLTNTAG